jgi:CRP/FNR family transcriptional regulator, cyclic AMP receptor protein
VRLASIVAAWGRLRGDDPVAVPGGAAVAELKARYLSAIDVFRDLPKAEIDRLAHTTTMFTAPRGRVLYRPGETSAALFLLKKGRVQIVRESSDGKRLVTAVLGPGTFFGEMALVGQRFPQDSAAEAVEEALICVLSRHDLDDLILKFPRVGLRFLEQVSARLLETEAIVEDFAFKSVPQRLATTLARLSDEASDGLIHASHQELADLIGTYRETVTLTLSHFRERGLVELGRRNIRIVDRTGVESLGG